MRARSGVRPCRTGMLTARLGLRSCVVLHSLGALARRCLSNNAHFSGALPITTRAGEHDRSWPEREVLACLLLRRFRSMSGRNAEIAETT
jgi:hypothetical protein